jgi:hypothetical protein
MVEVKIPTELVPQKCYLLGRITYLPHYSMPEYFVAPGMDLDGLSFDDLVQKLYLKQELMDAGAMEIMLPLWPRTSFNIKPLEASNGTAE